MIDVHGLRRQGTRVPRSAVTKSVLAVLIIAAAPVAIPSSAGAIPPARLYVAMGDSFTSSPFTGQPVGTLRGCLRSDNNYPRLASSTIRMEVFVDVSCAGATTDALFEPQEVSDGQNPPQLDALTTMAFAVSVGIGGNDIGFEEIARNCMSSQPTGSPCRDRYTAGGTDELAARIAATAPKVARVLSTVRERSPWSKVYLVGYPAIVPDAGPGCWPALPVTPDDVAYLRDTARRLNEMLAEQAGLAGATYVDTYGPSIGHDACAPPEQRWVEPLFPSSPAAPLHPNARGSAAMAAALASMVKPS